MYQPKIKTQVHCLILLFTLFGTLVFSQAVNAQQPAPYLYYYSNKDNAFVVERADGTDQHLFAKDETPRQKDPLGIDGPGWSPDGKWFAWISTYSAGDSVYRNGHVISADGRKNLNKFKGQKNIYDMYWSPNSKYLLVNLNPTGCQSRLNGCYTDTYWFVDATTDSILSIFDIGQQREPIGVEWATDKGEVNLYIWEDAWGQSADIAYLKITMHDDGRVKQPISREEWKANTPPDDFSSATDDKLFTSPSGRYSILVTQHDIIQIKDTQTGESIPVPKSQFGSKDPVTLKQPMWSASEEWVIGGYIDFNGLWGVGVFKVDGTDYCELATCGPSVSCGGWLPENVDVSQIAIAS